MARSTLDAALPAARIRPEQDRLIRAAAKLAGRTVSDLVRSGAIREASKTISAIANGDDGIPRERIVDALDRANGPWDRRSLEGLTDAQILNLAAAAGLISGKGSRP